MSIVIYFVSPELRTLWDNALQVFSEFSYAISDSPALWRVSRFLQRNVPVSSVVSTGVGLVGD